MCVGHTSVDDEPYGVWPQSVVQRHHYHGVGVAGQLRDDPLQVHVTGHRSNQSVNDSHNNVTTTIIHVYMGLMDLYHYIVQARLNSTCALFSTALLYHLNVAWS